MSLNVIGLVSGGKDSLFSLAHCLENDHKLVAIANLYPDTTNTTDQKAEDGEGPDLDSFMYQTVGHSVIPLYSEALGVPLYRRPITGTAIQNGRYYDTGPRTEVADEIEDMFALIQEVIKSHPEANALSAGAILSTYQRTRVESVATRLGLVPLAYLWQYPVLPPPSHREDSLTGLLEDMELSGCDARIIKIASGGIRADMSFSNVATSHTRAKLVSGMSLFFSDPGQEYWLRGAVLGEGGEYETLALNGPGQLWKKKICIDSYDTYEADGGTVYVRLGEASPVDQDQDQIHGVAEPGLLDQRFAVVPAIMDTAAISSVLSKSVTLPDLSLTDRIDMSSSWNKSSRTVQLFNLTSTGATAAEQLDGIVTTLPATLNSVRRLYQLTESCLGAENIVSTTLLLQSMADFASVNKVYTTRLWPQGLSNPPARVTVAASLPRDAKVSISLIYSVTDADSKSRTGLHVQSRSYWAPANIGPYSQAICVPAFEHGTAEIVHLAGQIPLVPSTMAMLEGDFVYQALLALQHLWRVAQERSVDQWTGVGVAFLAHTKETMKDDSVILRRAQEASRIWRIANEVDEKGQYIKGGHPSTQDSAPIEKEQEDEEEDFDIWDLQQRLRGFGMTMQKTTVGEHLHKLPYSVADAAGAVSGSLVKPPPDVPCFIAAEVLGLPRDAPVEWWSTGIAGLVSTAGSQTVKVSATPTVSEHIWTMSGLYIEGENSRKVDSAGDRSDDFNEAALGSERRHLCFFVTICIEAMTANEDVRLLPHTLEDLIPHLKQTEDSRDAFRWELCTAQSFLNLSCPLVSAIQEELELLQKSCVVMCNHVWTSGSAQPQPVGGSNDNIREVAAAIVLRIDATPE